MSRIRIASIVLSLACITPMMAYASTVDDLQTQISTLLQQISTLQAQIMQLNNAHTAVTPAVASTVSGSLGATICPVFSRTLMRGMSGSDVAALQQILSDDAGASYNAGVTGFFGPATAIGLEHWQATHGIISYGDAASTGLGVFGPRSRTAVQLLCASTSRPTIQTPPSSVSCPAMQIPLCTGTLVSQGTDANGCSLGYRCVTSASGNVPVVSGIDGPATIAVGTSGTWTVHASVPNISNASIRYGVVWGDESTNSSAAMSQSGASITANGTFTHAYSTTGTFAPTFTVSNDTGSASVSSSVTVTGGASCPAMQIPLCKGTLISLGTDANGCSLGSRCDDTASPTVSVNVSPTSVAQGAAPLTSGGTLHISWTATNVPSDSNIRLRLIDQSGADLGSIGSSNSTAGSYDWAVPGPQCDASGSCVYQTDSDSVYATKIGAYGIKALLVTPANGCLGFSMIQNCPQAKTLTSAASSYFTITSGPVPSSCTVIDCVQGYHPSGPSCSSGQTCVPN